LDELHRGVTSGVVGKLRDVEGDPTRILRHMSVGRVLSRIDIGERLPVGVAHNAPRRTTKKSDADQAEGGRCSLTLPRASYRIPSTLARLPPAIESMLIALPQVTLLNPPQN
jgi:hypothetical protein